MYNENRVRQVISAIRDNGLHAMDDESLAKLLSILTPIEFSMFEVRSYEELGGLEAMKRISRIRPMVELIVGREMYRIKGSLIPYFSDALSNGKYMDFFKALTVEELGDLKKYITFSLDGENQVQMKAAEKVIKLITNEIQAKDTSRKPTLINVN